MKDSQCLLVSEVDPYWTSLENDPYQAILLYHGHGTGVFCKLIHVGRHGPPDGA
jgi:hypothetical protein